MSLFICDRCECVDNTACPPAVARFEAAQGRAPNLCTECVTGAWHGQFPKRQGSAQELREVGFLRGSERGHFIETAGSERLLTTFAGELK